MADVAVLSRVPDGSNHPMASDHDDTFCGNLDCQERCWPHDADAYLAYLTRLLEGDEQQQCEREQ